MKVRGNALIVHGGGLVDPSKDVILRIANGIWENDIYDIVYLGKYSFMSLYDPLLWIPYNSQVERQLEGVRGTFFGTCRGIDLSSPELMKKTIEVLTKERIKTVIVCGGDGSSRQCAEINDEFQKNGISIIFAVPLTVDGINGGHSIGLEQAVRECVRQIENVAATSLETRDKGKFSVVAVELQGRNRDDILANCLRYFHTKGMVADCELDEIYLKVVPANYETNEQKLIDEVNETDKRTLLLISEGANLKVSELQGKTHRKVRTVVVGHAAQSNGMTTPEDMKKYSEWLSDVVDYISENPLDSYSIVNDGTSRYREPIDYFARLNPRENQNATLSKGLEWLLMDYMV